MKALANSIVLTKTLSPFRGPMFIFMLILIASLFGILTRPMGFLAAVWPANALLLAFMVRKPSLSTPAGWLAALLGYLAADLLTGGGLFITLWLTAANMAGAFVGYILFMRLSEEYRRLAQPTSIISLFWICTIAAAAAGVVGSGAALVLFERDAVTGFAFWFTTELVNALIVVPIVLPRRRSGQSSQANGFTGPTVKIAGRLWYSLPRLSRV